MASDNEKVVFSLGRTHLRNRSQSNGRIVSRRLTITNQEEVGEPLGTQTRKCHKTQPNQGVTRQKEWTNFSDEEDPTNMSPQGLDSGAVGGPSTNDR